MQRYETRDVMMRDTHALTVDAKVEEEVIHSSPRYPRV